MNVHRLDRGGATAGRPWLAGWLAGCDGRERRGDGAPVRLEGREPTMGENRQRAEHLLTLRDLVKRGVAVSVLIVGALLVLLIAPGI